MKILVTGASGAIARLVASALSPKYEWVGVDPRPCPSETHFPGEFIVRIITVESLMKYSESINSML